MEGLCHRHGSDVKMLDVNSKSLIQLGKCHSRRAERQGRYGFAVTATPKRGLSVSFSNPTYFNSFILVTPKKELKGLSWSQLNSDKYTFAVDMGSAQDLMSYQYLPNANMLRFKTRDEAIVAVATGKADGLVNTMLNGLVMSKKAATIGSVQVPTPVLSTPSVIALNPECGYPVEGIRFRLGRIQPSHWQ